MAALAAIGALACLAMGVFATPTAFLLLWYHWGAFVAPVEAIRGGGIPFADVPVQYGLGPTAAIAALCKSDCWPAAYLAVSVSNVLYLLAMGGCILTLTGDLSMGEALLAVSAMTVAVLGWAGYPVDFNALLGFPSEGGLRFLPLAALVLTILRGEAAGRPKLWLGHLIWLVSMVWSPEAAFFASVLWWPYVTMRRARAGTGLWPVTKQLVLGVTQAVLAVIAAYALFAVAFRMSFGAWPSVIGFLTYVKNPPGVLPPNLSGPLWLVLAALAGALFVMAHSNTRELPTRFACTAAVVAVFSYYIGRSHDNNVLNLFPFLVLTLVCLLRPGSPPVLAGFSRTVLACMLAWLACFGNQSWSRAVHAGNIALLGPQRLFAAMRLDRPEAQQLLADAFGEFTKSFGSLADAGSALAWLREQNAGPPLFISPGIVMARGVPGPTWTGMNNTATYDHLPMPVVEAYIRRGAASFRAPGWILVDRLNPGPWLDEFRVAYDIAEERAFGDYVAYRLVPRSGS